MGSIFNWDQCGRMGGDGGLGRWKLTGEMGSKSPVPTPAPQVTEIQAQRIAQGGQCHPPRACWGAEKGWCLLRCWGARALGGRSGVHKELCPWVHPRRRQESWGSKRAHNPWSVSSVPQDSPPGETRMYPHRVPPMSPLPEVLLGEIYRCYWLGWDCEKTCYRGV